MLEYKGYWTNIEFSEQDGVLYGKIEGIDDLVDFESESATAIVDEFHAAVDDYIDFCKEVGKEPNKSYRGCFNVRITPSLHRDLAKEAARRRQSLNECVEQAISLYLGKKNTIATYIQTLAASQVNMPNLEYEGMCQTSREFERYAIVCTASAQKQ